MFGALKKAFGGKAVELKVAARNIENKDLMEAAVDGMLLMAYSEDKKLGDDEKSQIEGLLRTNPKLSGFGTAVMDRFNQTNDALKAGYISARIRILREIEDVKHVRQDAEDVFAAILEVALGDGNVSDAERGELNTIAQKLGLRVEDFI